MSTNLFEYNNIVYYVKVFYVHYDIDNLYVVLSNKNRTLSKTKNQSRACVINASSWITLQKLKGTTILYIM